jgi:hypothetical protein
MPAMTYKQTVAIINEMIKPLLIRIEKLESDIHVQDLMNKPESKPSGKSKAKSNKKTD